MITPRFWLDQTDTSLLITILIKYAKLKSIEIDVQDNTFWFYHKPYHLKLTFSYPLKNDEPEKIQYNPIKSEILITVSKKNPGEHFSDLSLVSKILEPKPQKPKPKIEPIGESEVSQDDFLSQGYGFNHKENGFFKARAEEMLELFDIDPDNTQLEERFLLSKDQENSNWDLDRYFEDLDIALDQVPAEVLYKSYLPSISERMDMLSLEALIKIGNRSLLIHSSLIKPYLILTTELVLIFCYEIRSFGETSCESASNITKISPSLSCLLEFESLNDMTKKVMRRVLVYGVYRNLDFIKIAWHDTQIIFSEGKEAIVRILIKIKKILESSEPRYLINRLFIDDLIVWVQKIEILEWISEVRSTNLPDVSELELDFSFSLSS